MAYWKDKRQVAALFEERGYLLDPSVRQAQEFGVKRFVYEHPDNHLKADVFCDDLVMAHTIPFGGRLELGGPAITVTDLLLTKLQIHEFTDNDLIDCMVLLAEHQPGDTIDTDLHRRHHAQGLGLLPQRRAQPGAGSRPRSARRPRASRASSRVARPSATSRRPPTRSTVRRRRRSGSCGPGSVTASAGTKKSRRSTGNPFARRRRRPAAWHLPDERGTPPRRPPVRGRARRAVPRARRRSRPARAGVALRPAGAVCAVPWRTGDARHAAASCRTARTPRRGSAGPPRRREARRATRRACRRSSAPVPQRLRVLPRRRSRRTAAVSTAMRRS